MVPSLHRVLRLNRSMLADLLPADTWATPLSPTMAHTRCLPDDLRCLAMFFAPTLVVLLELAVWPRRWHQWVSLLLLLTQLDLFGNNCCHVETETFVDIWLEPTDLGGHPVFDIGNVIVLPDAVARSVSSSC